MVAVLLAASVASEVRIVEQANIGAARQGYLHHIAAVDVTKIGMNKVAQAVALDEEHVFATL